MTVINLLDAVFAHDVGSVAGKPPSYFTWNRLEANPRIRQQVGGPVVFTDGYIAQEWLDSIDAPLKIAWLREPQCLWPDNYRRAMELHDQFDVILTYYQPWLDTVHPQFKFCPYGGIWLPRQTWGIKPKTKNISMLIGNKMSTDGHRERHAIYQAIKEAGLKDQIDFYGVYGEPVEYGWQTKYKVLADYRYSIVCETCYDRNLFTEILLDCLAVGTIPLLWGLPNRDSFFQDLPDILLTSDLIWELQNGYYDEDRYNHRLDTVYHNLHQAGQYEITEDWLWHTYFKEMV